MFPQRSIITRSLAAVLPLCFLWVVVACMISCSSHETGWREARGSLVALFANGAHESDSCPIVAAPLSAMPENLSQLPHVGELHATLIAPEHSIGQAPSRIAHSPASRPPPLPPLDRLCTLRI